MDDVGKRLSPAEREQRLRLLKRASPDLIVAASDASPDVDRSWEALRTAVDEGQPIAREKRPPPPGRVPLHSIEIIRACLQRHGGNMASAAKELDMIPSSVQRRLKRGR